jgi:hypothetical protein
MIADAAGGAPALQLKRKKDDGEESGPSATPEPDAKISKTGEGSVASADSDSAKKAPMSKAREVRLEQNRKAARESRRRKKTMIEELQRSVIFFSRANSTLKQQNDELARILMQSQSQISSLESGQQSGSTPAQEKPQGDQQQQARAQAGSEAADQSQAAPASATQQTDEKEEGQGSNSFQQAQAQAVATQAVLESQVSIGGNRVFVLATASVASVSAHFLYSLSSFTGIPGCRGSCRCPNDECRWRF